MSRDKLAGEVIEAVLENHFTLISLMADRLDNEIREQALCVAAEYGRIRIVNLLLARGTDVRCNNDAPLFNAAAGGHLAVIRVLMRHGGVCTATAVEWAVTTGYYEILALLLPSAALTHEDFERILSYSSSTAKRDATTIIVRWCPREVLVKVRRWKSVEWNETDDNFTALFARQELAWRAR